MKKFGMFLVIMLILVACGVKKNNGEDKKMLTEERYRSESLLAENFEFRVRSSWTQGSYLYVLGSNRIVHEHQLLKYDLETQAMVTTKLDIEDSYLGYASSAYVDDLGELHAFCYSVNDEGTEITGYSLCVFDIDGKMVSEMDCTEALAPYVKGQQFPDKSIILSDGRILLETMDEKLNGYLVLLSKEGKLIYGKEIAKMQPYDLCLQEDGRVLDIEKDLQNGGGMVINEVDVDTGERKTLIQAIPEEPLIKFVCGSKTDAISYATNDGIWVNEGDKMKLLISLEDISLDGAYDVSEAIQMNDGTWRMLAVLARGEGEYNYFDYNILNIVKTEGELVAKTEVTLAVLADGKTLYKDEVSIFNKTRDDEKVVIKEYDSIDSLLADIIAGNIPDLVDLSEGEIYDSLRKKGLLEDLTPYFEKDERVSKGDFLEKALDFFENEGKLYAIPYGLAISAMMGNSSYLGNRNGWTISEYKDFINSLPNTMMATEGVSKQEILRFLCLQYQYLFIDQDRKECDFLKKEFYDLLEFANYYPAKSMDFNDVNGLFSDIQEGELILIPAGMQDIEYYEYFQAFFPEKVQVIGYPAEDRNGIFLFPIGRTLALTSASKNKNVAWDFIRQVITNKKSGYSSVFSSSRQFYDEMISDAKRDASDKEPYTQLPTNDLNLDVVHASIDDIEMIEGLIDRGVVVCSGDEMIIQIISEEAEAFFSGRKTSKQVAEIIQSRIKLYLME